MCGRFASAHCVVSDHSISLNPYRLPVNKDHWQVSGVLRDHICLVFSDRCQDKAVHPPAQESCDDCLLPLRVVVEAGGENGYSPGAKGILHGAVYLAAEWVGDAGQQEANREGPSTCPAEAAGCDVQLVVELRDGIEHLLPGGLGYSGLVVDHP